MLSILIGDKVKGDKMIRFRLKELIADREFNSGKRITFEEIAISTGIHRTTLSKIANQKGYNSTTDNLDKLCQFFGCRIENLVEYVSADGATSKPE